MTPEQIAAGLSEAERAWIDRLERFPLPFKKASHFDIPQELVTFTPSDIYGVVNVALSETGLEVRKILEARQ